MCSLKRALQCHDHHGVINRPCNSHWACHMPHGATCHVTWKNKRLKKQSSSKADTLYAMAMMTNLSNHGPTTTMQNTPCLKLECTRANCPNASIVHNRCRQEVAQDKCRPTLNSEVFAGLSPQLPGGAVHRKHNSRAVNNVVPK